MRNRTTEAESALVFAALGEPSRLKLVARLCGEGPLSITALAAGSGVTRQAVTKHLEILSEAGLVRDSWAGRSRVFTLDTRRLEIAQAYLDRMSQRWDDALERLRAHVEDLTPEEMQKRAKQS